MKFNSRLPHESRADRWAKIGLAALFVSGLPLSGQSDDSMHLDGQGFLGIGTNAPARQLHMIGDTANFRMDRSVNTAAFFLNRVDDSGQILKGFQVGANYFPPAGEGEFIISDMGQNSGGPGTRRMTITDNGDVEFTGNVTALNISSASSARFKENIEKLSGANQSISELEGVRFTWKESGEPSIGLIAEDVAKVFPELVTLDEDGEVTALNYQALVAVLVEAMKEQEAQIDAAQARLAEYERRASEQQASFSRLEGRLAAVELLYSELTGEDNGQAQTSLPRGPLVAHSPAE